MYWNFILKKTQDAVTTIVITTVMFSGGAVFAWNKLVIPEIKCQITQEQKETVRLLNVVLDELSFQKYVANTSRTPDEIDELERRYKQNKISDVRKK